MITTKKIIKIVIQNLKFFAKGLKIKTMWTLLGFCLIFQEEMMVQENLIELEKTMA